MASPVVPIEKEKKKREKKEEAKEEEKKVRFNAETKPPAPE